MRTVIALLVIIVCAVPLSGAAGERHPGHDTVWSQGPESGILGVASQYAYDYPFYAETATDFFALNDADVNHLHWWGRWASPGRDGLPVPSVSRVEWDGQGGRALVCNDPLWAGCNIVVAGDNTGGPNHADYYNCSSWLEDGPEVVYLLTIPHTPTTVTVTLSDLLQDLDIFLLSTCSENACITYGHYGFTIELPAGEYYLVVDGYYGAISSYTLTIECADVPPLYFVVRFYDHNVDQPGNLLYEHTFSDYAEVWDEDLQTFAYWADIPPFFIADGNFYWISIQSILSWAQFGQWFWQESDTTVLEWAVMDFEVLGVPRWTPLPNAIGKTVDMSIELAAIDTPVEAKSWGVIKSLYR